MIIDNRLAPVIPKQGGVTPVRVLYLIMKRIKIGKRWVGEGRPCFIIAEAGSNHNKSLSQAKRLIDVAKEAGVDAVKFQTFQAEKLTASKRDTPLFKTLKNYELPKKWHQELLKYANLKGLVFLSTPFDERGVNLLEDIGVLAFKVASGDITHFPLLMYIAKKGRPIILSTGASTLREVESALGVISNSGNEQIILLHCVVQYPANLKEVNLRALTLMEEVFPYPIGLSDHTLGKLVPLGAVALGAKVVEKHFTLDRTLPGPDHPFALEPAELKEMVREIRSLEKALGKKLKRPVKREAKMRIEARRGIYAQVDIPKDTTITKKMLKIVRPAKGIEPKDYDLVLGRKARMNIKEGEEIRWGKISNAKNVVKPQVNP